MAGRMGNKKVTKQNLKIVEIDNINNLLIVKGSVPGKKNSIVFALSNPNPEIMPEDVPSNVSIIATGRSDYPNQVNNSLAYPGFFRGLVDSRAKKITVEMEIAASKALASVIENENLSEDFIMPSMFDGNVVKKISDSITSIVSEQSLSRKKISNSGYNSFKRFH